MKIKKKILKRILFMFMLAITLMSCFSILSGTPSVFADDEDGFEIVAEGTMIALDGLVGIILVVPKLGVIIFGILIQTVLNAVGTSVSGSFVSIENIIFTGSTNSNLKGIELLDVDFFDFNTTNSTVLTFRQAVAQWYYILRLISAAILLVILIYVGIRMALSTVAQEQAKYKQMIVDWVTSLALLFLLHYIIKFIIAINDSLINAFAGLVKLVGGETVGKVFNDALIDTIFTSGIGGMFSAIMYIMVKGQALMFFVLYAKRMITVGFLIMIAPLITITYSIDKIGDGKAQALNAWLKELTYNILIQPFHCIIYLAFFGSIAEILDGANIFNITPYILSFVVLLFMKKAEGIIRKIFHFEAQSMSSMSETGQDIMNAKDKFKKMGMSAGKAVSNFRAAGGFKAIKQDIGERRQNRQENKQLKEKYKNSDKLQSNFSSFKEFKNSETGQKALDNIKKTNAAEMKAKADAKRAKKDKKIEDKARQTYDAEHGAGSYDLLKNVASQKDKNGKPTKAAQKAQEKLNAVNGAAKDKIENTMPKRAIRGVASGASNVAKGWNKFTNSRTGQVLGAYMKDSTKVVSALAAGGFMGGMTGEVNDIYSGGQFGYGLAAGILENSNKTITKDAVKSANQYMEVSGKEADFNGIKAKGDAGMFKEISKMQSELIREITKIVGDKDIAKDAVAELMSRIGKGEKVNYNDIVSDLNIQNPDEEQKVSNLVQDYSETVIESHLYANVKQAEGVGIDVDTLSMKVEKKTEKVVEKMQDVKVNVQTNVKQDSNGNTRVDTMTQTGNGPTTTTTTNK